MRHREATGHYGRLMLSWWGVVTFLAFLAAGYWVGSRRPRAHDGTRLTIEVDDWRPVDDRFAVVVLWSVHNWESPSVQAWRPDGDVATDVEVQRRPAALVLRVPAPVRLNVAIGPVGTGRLHGTD